MSSQLSSDSSSLRPWKFAMLLLVQALAVSATVSANPSQAPSVTPVPTVTQVPSYAPTVSHAPTISDAPTVTNLYCRVEMVDIWTSFEAGEDNVIGNTADEFECMPMLENGEHTLMRFRIPDTPQFVQDAVEDCQNEASCPGVVIAIPGGTIQGSTVDVPDHSAIKIVHHFDDHHIRRALAPTSGDVKMVILRISDTTNNNADCGISHQELKDLYFDKTNSLKDQTFDCSRGTLNIQKTNPAIIDVPINIDTQTRDRNEVYNAATLEAERIVKEDYGYANLGAFADYFVYAMPDMPGWIAYAYVGGRASVYSAQWGRYLTVMQHEIAHNMGIRHSFEMVDNAPKAYQDRSGVMGGALWGIHNVEYGPQMCFNAAHFGQSGWHSDLTYSADPDSTSIVPLVAFVDHGHSSFIQDWHYTHVQTQVTGNRQYWIHYNAKKSYNSGTAEYPDMVTITRLETNSGQAFRGSLHVAALDPTQTNPFYVENKNGRIWMAQICNVLTQEGLEVLGLYVGYVDSESYSFCADNGVYTSNFEPSPTSAPTKAPTSSPVSGTCATVGEDCSNNPNTCCPSTTCTMVNYDPIAGQVISQCTTNGNGGGRDNSSFLKLGSPGDRNRGGRRKLRGAK